MHALAPLGLAGTLRWQTFRTLERLAALRAAPAAAAPLPAARPGARWLWLYVSTIGELNAIHPFLDALLARLGAPPLLLLTDHTLYRTAYLGRLGGREVEIVDIAAPLDYAALAARCPPALLLIAEIPSLLHDAPCRFPFALPLAAARAGAPRVLVNGWLYGAGPSCRMDAIERDWFGSAYPRLLDLCLVQNATVRERLLAAGADPARVEVTGNIKFDALTAAPRTPPAERAALLDAIAASGRPCIVTGCVTNVAEQQAVLDAHATVLAAHPQALLVLTPRHPEKPERMATLAELLAARGLGAAWRSGRHPGAWSDAQVLVLDTFGELADFYRVGHVCYVGLNHNVLEPLAVGRPVQVTPGWEPRYPSYPVYVALRDAGAIEEVPSEAALGAAWVRALAARDAGAGVAAALAAAHALAGATARDLAALERHGLLPATA